MPHIHSSRGPAKDLGPMFSVGTAQLGGRDSQPGGATSSTEEERRCLAHLRGCFAERELERALVRGASSSKGPHARAGPAPSTEGLHPT